jgi:hypothetical protein
MNNFYAMRLFKRLLLGVASSPKINDNINSYKSGGSYMKHKL